MCIKAPLKVVLPVLIAGLATTACIPENPIMKGAVLSITAGSASYSLDEYCAAFDKAQRANLRAQINQMSVHRAEVTCHGD